MKGTTASVINPYERDNNQDIHTELSIFHSGNSISGIAIHKNSVYGFIQASICLIEHI